MADRIQGQAIRRCGELLREIESQQGARTDLQPRMGTHTKSDPKDSDVVPPMTRTQAARDDGLSKRQAVTAVRVAKIPEEEFEKQIESENPPTVTQLAKHGKRPLLSR